MKKTYYLALCLGVLLSGCAEKTVSLTELTANLQNRSGYELTEKTVPDKLILPTGIDPSNGINEHDAIRLALWNNATLQETLTELGLARADLLRANILPNPHLSMFFPLGPKQLEFTIRYPLEALWLRPRKIDIAELEVQRVGQSLVQNGLDMIRDVKIAMAEMDLAEKRADIAKDSAKVLQRSAALADARYRAGEVSELDVSTATNDAIRAKLEASLLVHEIKVKYERLRMLTGLTFRDVTFIQPVVYQPPKLSRSETELLDDALAARPDLRAAELAIEVAGQKAGLAKTEIYKLTGIFDSNSIGTQNMFEAGPGAELSIPIFDRNQAGIARTDTQLLQAGHGYVKVRDQIALEVRQSLARYKQAKQGIRAWRDKMVEPLQKTLEQANKAYAAGETSMLPVLDATWNLFDAKRREAESVAGLRTAVADLERSLGGRLALIPSQKVGVNKKQ